MKTRKSLNRRILTYVGISSAVFVVLYSMVIASYFIYGLTLNNQLILSNEAKAYAQAYEKDNLTPKPERSFLKSFRHESEIPAPLLNLFPLSQRQHGEMRIFDTSDFTYEPEVFEDVERLTALCHGQVCEIIFFYSYQLEGAQWFYLAMGITPDSGEEDQMQLALYVMLSIATAFFVTLMALTFALVKNISQPITELAQWAEQLTIDNVHDDIPNLRFKELEIVANQLQDAFERIGRVLDNEKRFLNNASHELRTPVAVLATNLALLEKLRQQQKDDESQGKVIERLIRAVENMKQLMQTVLWLSKETQDIPQSQTLTLQSLLAQIIDENRYLISLKTIDLKTVLTPQVIHAPQALCIIVFTNLIRNAFQYTHNGVIDIVLSDGQISVSNRCEDKKHQTSSFEEYGFGLGLELVRRACNKLNWQFTSEDIEGGRCVTLHFSSDQIDKISVVS